MVQRPLGRRLLRASLGSLDLGLAPALFREDGLGALAQPLGPNGRGLGLLGGSAPPEAVAFQPGLPESRPTRHLGIRVRGARAVVRREDRLRGAAAAASLAPVGHLASALASLRLGLLAQPGVVAALQQQRVQPGDAVLERLPAALIRGRQLFFLPLELGLHVGPASHAKIEAGHDHEDVAVELLAVFHVEEQEALALRREVGREAVALRGSEHVVRGGHELGAVSGDVVSQPVLELQVDAIGVAAIGRHELLRQLPEAVAVGVEAPFAPAAALATLGLLSEGGQEVLGRLLGHEPRVLVGDASAARLQHPGRREAALRQQARRLVRALASVRGAAVARLETRQAAQQREGVHEPRARPSRVVAQGQDLGVESVIEIGVGSEDVPRHDLLQELPVQVRVDRLVDPSVLEGRVFGRESARQRAVCEIFLELGAGLERRRLRFLAVGRLLGDVRRLSGQQLPQAHQLRGLLAGVLAAVPLELGDAVRHRPLGREEGKRRGLAVGRRHVHHEALRGVEELLRADDEPVGSPVLWLRVFELCRLSFARRLQDGPEGLHRAVLLPQQSSVRAPPARDEELLPRLAVQKLEQADRHLGVGAHVGRGGPREDVGRRLRVVAAPPPERLRQRGRSPLG